MAAYRLREGAETKSVSDGTERLQLYDAILCRVPIAGVRVLVVAVVGAVGCTIWMLN